MAVNKNLAGSFGNGGFLVNDNPNYWNARNQAAISSEKAYGNPAMNPAVATTFADQTFKGDPWYALGRMIGAGYMQNYNERGINKNIETANEAIKGTYGDLSGTGTQQQPQATAQPIQYNNNVPSDYSYQGRENKGELMVPVADQIKQEKLEYRKNQYADSPNPTSDGIVKANAEAQAKAEAERIDGFRKLDPVMMYNLGADAIKKRGGTKYQQDMALAQLREQIGGYMASANKQIFDYDSKEVENMINNGQYEKAWSQWPKLAKLDPDRAKILYAGIPTVQQIMDNRYKQAMLNARSNGYGRSTKGLSGQANVDGRWIGRRDAVTKDENTSALSTLKYFDGLETLTQAQEIAKKNAQDTVNRYNSPNHGAIRGYNIDSEQDFVKYIKGVAENVKNNTNMSGTDILNTIRNDGIMLSPYWDDGYLELFGLSSDGMNND